MDKCYIENNVKKELERDIYYKYDGVAYSAELFEDTMEFKINIYDSLAIAIYGTDEEVNKHLLKEIIIDFSHIDSNNSSEIVDYIVDYIAAEI